MTPAIDVEGLTKDYKVGFWRPTPCRARDGLTLQVRPGEVFGFLGPNGAGKTTTLKLLMQLIFPTGGSAEILGRPVGDVATRRRIGVATLLDRVGLGAERRLQMRKFSKGMIQRVGIAQALLNDPEVIFLDEPMSGLDPLGRRDVRSLILELRDQGRTVFFSSHILSDAETLCSRVAVVAKGRLAASGSLTEILAFEVHGWELVVSNLGPEVLARIAPSVRRTVEISPGRYALELALDPPPERLLADLIATGASLVSLNPLRDTLED